MFLPFVGMQKMINKQGKLNTGTLMMMMAMVKEL